MAETMVKCRCCGDDVHFAGEEMSWQCGFCRTVNMRPRAMGDTLNLLNLATEQRLSRDFAYAEESYRRVLEIQKDEYEARWGLALCKYGVEYVEDARMGKQLPVCHNVRVRPMQEDPDYLQACQLAPENVREGYQRDAAYIDQAQQRIRELEAYVPAYDVFICYKETEMDSSDRAEDSLRAQAVYIYPMYQISQLPPEAVVAADKSLSADEPASNTLTGSKRGFASDVNVRITLDADGAISGINIDFSGETEGFGQRLMSEPFGKQFIGKTAPFELGNGIDAVAGATVTSQAIVDVLNELLMAVR